LLYFTVRIICRAKSDGPTQDSYSPDQESHEWNGETRWIETGSRIVTNHRSLEQVAGSASGFVSFTIARQPKAGDDSVDNPIEAIHIRWCALSYQVHS